MVELVLLGVARLDVGELEIRTAVVGRNVLPLAVVDGERTGGFNHVGTTLASAAQPRGKLVATVGGGRSLVAAAQKSSHRGKEVDV